MVLAIIPIALLDNVVSCWLLGTVRVLVRWVGSADS